MTLPSGNSALVRADASRPKHCTGVLGLTTSGVSMPMKRTRSTRRPILARMVSPSTTRTTTAWALDPGVGSAPTGVSATAAPPADRGAAGALVPHPLAASVAASATRRSNRTIWPRSGGHALAGPQDGSAGVGDAAEPERPSALVRTPRGPAVKQRKLVGAGRDTPL